MTEARNANNNDDSTNFNVNSAKSAVATSSPVSGLTVWADAIPLEADEDAKFTLKTLGTPSAND